MPDHDGRALAVEGVAQKHALVPLAVLSKLAHLVDATSAVLDGQEWSADTAAACAQALRHAGVLVGEPGDDHDTPLGRALYAAARGEHVNWTLA
jgi:hypothetical protein